MPLSDYEQRVIDDLERSLLHDDPKLAQTFKNPNAQPYRRIISVAVGVLLGIALLIVGSIIQQPLLVAVGFGAIFVALAWAASAKRQRLEVEEEQPVDYISLQPKELATSNTSDSTGRFMDRLEDRWNRRQSELG